MPRGPRNTIDYAREAISLVELLVSTLRVVHGQETDMDVAICVEIRTTDLETLEEMRNLAYNRTQRSYQEESLGSKFALSWVEPYLIKEANDSGYYRLATTEGESLMEPINGKWLKLYYD
nr:hypothetical protein CFP56_40363 [Quercus suber]